MAGTKLLITQEDEQYLFTGRDIHTNYGFVKTDIIEKAKPGTIVETNTGKKMYVLEAAFIDLYHKIKRSAQIIPRKDVGIIVAETGLSPDWKIVDAGAGSGALCCFLAHLVPKGKVYTYDLREDHLTITQHNITFLGLKNITAQLGDVYQNIPHKNIDLITLDVPEPWQALHNAVAALKPGGFIVSYSPSIPQTSDFVNAVRENKQLLFLKTVEIMSREWEVLGRKVRPATMQPIGHSGFITFVRKISL
ncbi:methyltransferase domain-containing protein [Candidatus Woesearchaeota archaeon]|nr:methyltransferase domain-containing protein [Candidatus Woesearchaeota archaeon]